MQHADARRFATHAIQPLMPTIEVGGRVQRHYYPSAKMAFPKQSSRATARIGARKGARKEKKVPLEVLMGIGFGTVAFCFLVIGWSMSDSVQPAQPHKEHKKPIPAMGNAPNAIAMDIIRSLECETHDFGFADSADSGDKAKGGSDRRRRLGEDKDNMADDINFSGEEESEAFDGEQEDWSGGDWNDRFQSITGRHLFCLVAGSEKLTDDFKNTDKNKGEMHCDGTDTRREALLNVWSSARSQMTLETITKVLDLAVEKSYTLSNEVKYIWAPSEDESTQYYVDQLTGENSSIKKLDSLQGNGGLFVDIGSGLGLSTLAVSLLYPEATVLSVEPAMPSWLLQRINLVCNLEPHSKMPHPIMSVVGTKNDGMLKMMWRPSSTGTTRAWTPASERTDQDIELIVRLRTLRSILAEAAADEDVNMDAPSAVVLNIDCEGCEYNIIPAMSDVEFDAIDTIIGTNGVHWGYIPADKLPSSSRGSKTHERLCTHYDFARLAIECCAFPDLKVKRPGLPLVSEVNGDLCANFQTWADEKRLFTSTDDYGWSELTSMA